MRIMLALMAYIGSLTLISMGAFLANPLAANPDKWVKCMMITCLVQIVSASYLFTRGLNKSDVE
jgi:hypothetical protein